MNTIATVQVSRPENNQVIDTDLTKASEEAGKSIHDRYIGDKDGNKKKDGIYDKVKEWIGSDKRLKEIFGSDDVVANFAKLNAYEFKYKPEAVKLYKGKYGIDEGTNVGVMAQELEKNPVTENVVTENENGHKVLDTRKLTTANSAVLSDVCKRLLNIERILGIETNVETNVENDNNMGDL